MTDGAPGSDLAALAIGQCQQWRLTQDGAIDHRSRAVVLPVRTAEGTVAVLKISASDAGSEHEHLALRRWNGTGAARLLRADPHHRAVLVERLRSQTLEALPDVAACEVVADLHRRLHVAPLPQLISMNALAGQWIQQMSELPRDVALPRRLIEQAVASGRDLTTGATNTDVLLHGDLHYGNVLAADREPWLAISPRPVNGDPHAELAPMLCHHYGDLAGHLRDAVLARFHAIVDAAGLDEDLARAWSFLRVIHAATRALHGDADTLTRYVAVAKALQD